MALTPGSRLGVYEITAPLGEGGMGQVWRATDTTLGRQVAIKILPDAFAADPDRLARFEREAKTLASLNHPHIAAIHGFEAFRSGGSSDPPTRALIMELVEGEDLSQRITRGAIPLDEALPIAKQIAEALEAAHEQGIIHRDLKPANIKVRADGTVKVLDFGLAKAVDPPAASGVTAMNSPTLSVHATQAGIILGTAAYMSPEQARGKAVDKRTDIWAFGAVLYEMLTGTRAFPGEDLTDTLAAVVRAEPDWSAIPRGVPPTLLAFLKRSLQKDPKQRVSDIHDMRLAMEGAFETAASPATLTTAASSRGRLPWIVATAAVVGMAAMAVPTLRYLRETPTPAPPETRLEIATPATSDLVSFAVSPDGRQIVFVASGDGAPRLWVRPLDTTAAQPLAGTDGASSPFWSPDSRSIGFFADGRLKRLDLAGGAPQTLALANLARGGAWSADGVILFAPRALGPLSRVPAGGGDVVPVTTLGAGQSGHRFPQFLPGGRQFLYYVQGSTETQGIYLGALDATAVTRLTAADTAGAYTPPGSGPAEASSELGWLLFGSQGTLVARRFGPARGALSGDPVTVADALAIDTTMTVGAFSVSATGLVTYRAGGASPRQLTWFDRAGQALGTLGAPDATQFDPTLSPDGRQVAVERRAQDNTDIWLIDAARTTRFTFDSASDRWPVWSPDGSRLVFSQQRAGIFDLYQKQANGAGAEALLLASPETKTATSWSPDGRSLLYTSTSSKTSPAVWVLPMAGDPKPWPFLNSTFNERSSAFSPDGRWVAYHSDESGLNEIYVRPFPGPGGQWQVSTAGGKDPRWRPDGKELYYIAPDGRLMAAPIASSGTALQPGLPTALFQPRIAGGGTRVSGTRQQYDVAPDGRFLINTVVESGAAPITIIQNWSPGAKK